MSNDKLKGGMADKMSVSDIAKKHGVSVEAIEKEIEIGMKVEKEHTSSKGKEREITMDHLVEDPVYYSDPITGLIAKEKAAEKKIEKVDESKRFMALAGIKEDDKKFLVNESFSEERSLWGGHKITPESLSELDLDSSKNDDFIVIKFTNEEVEPGEDDDLYNLKQ